MGRMLLYPFVGAGIGFLAAVLIIQIMLGASPPRDTLAITMFAGIFLAGCGAIAGAIVGGVESSKRSRQATDTPWQRESDSSM